MQPHLQENGVAPGLATEDETSLANSGGVEASMGGSTGGDRSLSSSATVLSMGTIHGRVVRGFYTAALVCARSTRVMGAYRVEQMMKELHGECSCQSNTYTRSKTKDTARDGCARHRDPFIPEQAAAGIP